MNAEVDKCGLVESLVEKGERPNIILSTVFESVPQSRHEKNFSLDNVDDPKTGLPVVNSVIGETEIAAPIMGPRNSHASLDKEGDYCRCHQGARPKTRVTSSSSGGSRSGGSSPDARSLEEKSDRSHRLKFKKPNGGVPGNVAPTPRCAKPFVNGGTTNPEPWEVNQLKKDLEIAREELRRTRVVLADLQDRERKMKDRLAEQAQKMLERGVRFENVSMGERRPTALIRKYGNLYAQARVDTLDALDALEELRDGDELKSKLLFSVVVLAFRSVQANVLEIKGGIRRALQIPDTATSVAELPPSARELEASVNSFLRDTIERFDIRKCVEEVCSQIWATLYDYPCLKGCDGLIQYVRDCVRLAWGLANQHPPFVIEYETRTFRRDMHVRFHASNQDSAEIKTYLWPALLEGHEGPCVHKGVVVT